MTKKTFTITSDEGLHARPASELAKVAMKVKSELKMYLGGDMSKIYNPKSILSIMTMGASKGDEILFEADGEDEVFALEEIEKALAKAH